MTRDPFSKCRYGYELPEHRLLEAAQEAFPLLWLHYPKKHPTLKKLGYAIERANVAYGATVKKKK